MLLRPARPDEAADLTELALCSKGHWGYDQDFLAACRAELTIAPGDVVARRTTVAEVDGRVVGMYTLDGDPPIAELGQMFVHPDVIGYGVGRALWRHAVATAAELGITALTIDADPFAEGFYLAMGPCAPVPSRPGRSRDGCCRGSPSRHATPRDDERRRPLLGSVPFVIGLPEHVTALLFDLDGVLTGTAALHRAAWKETFDPLLVARGLPPFSEADYNNFVDGRPRFDGVRAFLASRDIVLPEAAPDVPAGDDSVQAVGNRKNDLVQAIIAERGVNPYPGSVRYIEAAHAAGLKIGVVTSSANGKAVLDAADLSKFVEARIDGVTIVERGLAGKPAPDSFIAGAEALGVPVANAAVFEDALSGVAAGRAGGFGYVVGVDRAGQAEALRAQGADVVVADLAELLAERP